MSGKALVAQNTELENKKIPGSSPTTHKVGLLENDVPLVNLDIQHVLQKDISNDFYDITFVRSLRYLTATGWRWDGGKRSVPVGLQARRTATGLVDTTQFSHVC